MTRDPAHRPRRLRRRLEPPRPRRRRLRTANRPHANLPRRRQRQRRSPSRRSPATAKKPAAKKPAAKKSAPAKTSAAKRTTTAKKAPKQPPLAWQAGQCGRQTAVRVGFRDVADGHRRPGHALHHDRPAGPEKSPDWEVLSERYERATRLAPILRSSVVEGPIGIQTHAWSSTRTST